MKHTVIALTAAFLLVLSMAYPQAQAGEGGNPLVEEMLKLDGVMREVVSAVSLGDGQRVHAALETMHGTMEKTHEGVHHGHVKIPKNADKVERFVELDKEFHHRLEDLAHAAHKGNQDKMLSITQELLKRCVQCHREYR